MITTLEKLKMEAAEVARKAAETDKVIAEVSFAYSFVNCVNFSIQMKFFRLKLSHSSICDLHKLVHLFT